MQLADALEWVESWAPGHRGSLTPASPEELRELERISARPLGAPQRDLLMTMGGAPAALFRGFIGMDVRASTLLTFYQSEGMRFGPPLSLLGCDADTPVVTMLVDDPTREHPWVAQTMTAGVLGAWARPEETPLEPLAESLGALIVNCAFFNFVAYRFTYELFGQVLEPEDGDRERLDETLRAVGFTREPIPVHSHGYYRHELAAAVCSQIPGGDPIQVYAFSDDPGILERLAQAVAEHTALQVHHVWRVADILEP